MIVELFGEGSCLACYYYTIVEIRMQLNFRENDRKCPFCKKGAGNPALGWTLRPQFKT